jgi:hypothetical protein
MKIIEGERRKMENNFFLLFISFGACLGGIGILFLGIGLFIKNLKYHKHYIDRNSKDK